MTNNTPIKINIVPIQKDKPICSPSINQPKKVPTIGCKKKNTPVASRKRWGFVRCFKALDTVLIDE